MLAIDPGYAKREQGCACARFAEGVLVAVRFARVTDAPDVAWMPDGAPPLRVVVERPQVDRRTRGREVAVVNLAWEGAALAYWIAGATDAAVTELTPTQWKGSARKPQHHARLWSILYEPERRMLGGDRTRTVIEAAKRAGAAERWRRGGGAAYYPSGFAMHNILDAVGLGCFALGRLS